MGRGMFMRLTLPLVGAGVAVAKLGGDFESEMSKIVGLVGVAEDQVASWSDEILRIAPSLGKSPVELAKAMFFVTSAGFRGAEAMDVLTQSAKASAGGMGETAVVADAVTSAVNSYASTGLKASKATDILTAAVREGKLEAASLAPVLGRVLPMASAMGVTFEDTAGFLAVMSRTGMDAAEGAVALQGMLMNLQKPAEGAKKALKGTGISFQSLRDMVRKPGGVIEAVRLLDKTFGDDEEALAELIPNVRALRGAMNILAQDSSIVDSVMKGVANAAGSTDKAFKAASKTFKFQLAAAISKLKVLLIAVGRTALPLFAEALARVQEVLEKVQGLWQGLSSSTKKAVIVIAAVVTVVGPLLIALGGLISLIGFTASGVGVLIGGVGVLIGMLGALLSPLAIITASVAGLGAAVLHWTGVGGKMVAWFGEQWKNLVDHIQPAIDGIKNAIAAGDIELAFKIMWAQIQLTFAEGIQPLSEMWIGFATFFKTTWIEAIAFIGRTWNDATSGLALAWEALKAKYTGDTLAMAEAVADILGQRTLVARQIEAVRVKNIEQAEEEAASRIAGIQSHIKGLQAERDKLAAGALWAAVAAAMDAAIALFQMQPVEIPVVPKFEPPPKPIPVSVGSDLPTNIGTRWGSAQMAADWRANQRRIGGGVRDPQARVVKAVKDAGAGIEVAVREDKGIEVNAGALKE
jgi:TP901 family phage tail tape measure protein